MSITAALRGVALLSVMCGACANEQLPLAPSPVQSLPQLTGSYTLTLTPCDLRPDPPPGQPDGNRLVSDVPNGPYRSMWTFTQQDAVVTGRYRNDAAPAVSSGTLTARVELSGRLVVDTLRYSWSSSHVGTLQFSAAGDGAADKTQIAGTVSGEESWTTPFGFARYSCSGTGMAFRFTRRD
jgi:hypothetical protein